MISLNINPLSPINPIRRLEIFDKNWNSTDEERHVASVKKNAEPDENEKRKNFPESLPNSSISRIQTSSVQNQTGLNSNLPKEEVFLPPLKFPPLEEIEAQEKITKKIRDRLDAIARQSQNFRFFLINLGKEAPENIPLLFEEFISRPDLPIALEVANIGIDFLLANEKYQDLPLQEKEEVVRQIVSELLVGTKENPRRGIFRNLLGHDDLRQNILDLVEGFFREHSQTIQTTILTKTGTGTTGLNNHSKDTETS